ncbi:hypothetical protein OAJ94_03455 [Deltaproteobacteria bacterium]|nr:hypothetical protein [Deltaproteobacteria bacterium]
MKNKIFLIVLMLIGVFIPASSAQVPEAPNWTIDWVEDLSSATLLDAIDDKNSSDWWDKGGIITFEFYIENTRPTELNIVLQFEADHEGEFNWVEVDLDESVKVAGASNKTFEVTLEVGSLNDVDEGIIHGFSIIAEEDLQLPTNPQIIEADTKVPRIAIMMADIIDKDIPLLAGTETEIKVELTNFGNKNDKLKLTETENPFTIDGCPQLSIQVDDSLSQAVLPGSSAEGMFVAKASSSHPTTECIITLKSISDGGASVSDSLSLEVSSSSSSNGGSSSSSGNNDTTPSDDDSSNDDGLNGNFLPSISAWLTIFIIGWVAIIRRDDILA